MDVRPTALSNLVTPAAMELVQLLRFVGMSVGMDGCGTSTVMTTTRFLETAVQGIAT